ncbi:MAG: hypothetical protein QM296_07880 [Bacillota bacterium]|nr:hypothetical protein [Bacillota bacterium]
MNMNMKTLASVTDVNQKSINFFSSLAWKAWNCCCDEKQSNQKRGYILVYANTIQLNFMTFLVINYVAVASSPSPVKTIAFFSEEKELPNLQAGQFLSWFRTINEYNPRLQFT